MKLFAQRLGILALSAGILFPTSVLSQTTKQLESPNRQQPILLAQTSMAQQETIANAGIAQFKSGYQQLGATKSNPKQQMQIVNALIPIAQKNTQNTQVLSNLWQQQAFAAPNQQSAVIANQFAQHYWLMSQTYAGWSQTLPKVFSAIRSKDQPTLDRLAQGEALALQQRMAQHDYDSNQLTQAMQSLRAASQAQSQEQTSQMYSDFSNSQTQGIIDRGRATKCMVSSYPSGSPAEIQANPSAYCNAP